MAYYAVYVNYNGVLIGAPERSWLVWDSSTLTGLVTTAHQHGVKVVVTLRNVYSDLIDFCDMLYNYQTTVIQIVNQVKLKNVDGVNIDFESQLGMCNPNPPLVPMTNQALLTQFAKYLRAGLDAAKPGYYLSIATYSGSASGTDGFFNIPDLNQYVDSFFVMAYDMDQANQGTAPVNCSGFCMAPISPMANYYWNDSTSMSQYAAVVGAGKTILGQPLYGRVACVVGTPWVNPPSHDIATGPAVAATYLDAVSAIYSPDVRPVSYSTHREADDPTGQDRWDTWWDNSLGCWREMYWQDTITLGARYDFVNQLNLRGVGFWTLNYGGGASELWNTLDDHFVKCSNASVTPSPSTQPAGSTIVFTASSTVCSNPRYQFFIQYPDGTWNLKQGWGGPGFTWDTTGLSPGVYTMHAWANALGTDYDSIGSSTITLTGCTAASVSPSSTTQPSGSVINFTATSSGGCPNPLFEFFVQYPNGTWNLKQGWGGPTFSWDTTGLVPGIYTLHAWAGQHGAATTLEAYGSSAVTLTICNGASLNPAGPSAPAGSTVAFTASSTGCLNPEYEFFVQYPNGSWNLKQGWGGATFNWDSTGLAPGVYTVHAWVNDHGTGHEAIGESMVTVTGCTSASLSPPNPSAPAGSMVALTATSGGGCPNPVYEFWVLYPNGTWNLKQGWGASAIFNWDTSGLAPGVYTVHAWANQQGAATTLEVFGSTTVTLTGCTSASVSPSSGSSAAGSMIAFTATAMGCPNPVYEFFLLDPAGTWHLMQSFGTNNAWTWSSAGSAKGTYTVHVWANNQGADTGRYETIGSATYTLT